MKALISSLSFLLIFVTTQVIAEKKDHIKFMQPMIPFQVCVLDTSLKYFTNKVFINLHSKESGVLGDKVWQKVLSKCKEHVFSDKTKGLILLAYSGDTKKTLGYLEGTIYSARNYVFIKSLKYENSQP